MVEIDPCDSDHTSLGSYHCLRVENSSWFVFTEIVIPMAGFEGFAARRE
jgi:hypothetical protein